VLTRRRALLCSFYFPPASAIGARRPGRLARLLPEHGFDVDVVSAPFNLDQRSGLTASDPSQVILGEHAGSTLRVPVPFSLGRDPYEIPPPGLNLIWWKARAYLEAIFLTRDWADRWGAAAAERFATPGSLDEYDLVILDAPPSGAVAPMARIAEREGVPVVVDFRDLLLPPGNNGAMLFGHQWRRNRWQGKDLTDLFDIGAHFFFVSPAAATEAIDTMGIDPERVSVVTNAFLAQHVAKVDALSSDGRTERETDRPLRIVHAGHLVYNRAKLLRAVLGGAERYTQDTGRDVEVILVGAAPAALESEFGRVDFDGKVKVLGWLPREEVIRIQREADALLLLQPADGPVGHRVIIPGKLFEYMAVRRPIISLATPPTDDIVRGHGLGAVVAEPSADAVYEAFGRMDREDMWGRDLPEPPMQFSEADTVRAFADVLRDIVHQSR
jgi:glycosyltransferase involved in cell wall biosynthesis